MQYAYDAIVKCSGNSAQQQLRCHVATHRLHTRPRELKVELFQHIPGTIVHPWRVGIAKVGG